MATNYGVQSDGSFKKKPVDVIRDEVKQDFLNEIGQDIELRPSSPIIQVINAVSLELAKQWAAAEGTYYASFFEDSFGDQLDKQLALAGFQRKPLRGATGEVTLSRDSTASQDITVPSGTIVQAPKTNTRPRIPFKTTETVIIAFGTSSVSGVSIEALEPWETDVDKKWLGEETNLSAGTVTEFKNPVSGVDSVNNPNPTGDKQYDYIEGRDEETDAEFKNRYLSSLAQSGAATVDAVKAEVVNADPEIASVDVLEVYDTANDEYGVEVTVLAPNVVDDTIAQAIFDSRAGGLESFGSSSGTATNEDGETFTEQFNRATAVDVAIEITLTTDSTFPSDGQSEIEDRLVQYIGGTDNSGTSFPGLNIGEDVIFDQVFRRVINQDGVIEAAVDMGPTGGTLNKDNIAVGSQEAAQIALADITFL